MSQPVIILGATGRQGGATIKALLAKEDADFQILAVTRDASSPSARRLAARSPRIALVQGSLDDVDGLFAGAKKAAKAPIWGILNVQPQNYEAKACQQEVVQGKALVDASLANGIQYFVYASVDRHGSRSATNPTPVWHFASKHEIEQYLTKQTAGKAMRWAILRPVAFMDNLMPGIEGKVLATVIRDIITSRPLQLVATEDVGIFAAEAFIHPEIYAGRAISLAGDSVTFEQLDVLFRRKTGKPVPTTWSLIAKFAMWMSTGLGIMMRHFDNEGFDADIEEARKLHPGLMDLGDWIDRSPHVKK